MAVRVIQQDNGYFEDVELTCCGERVRVWTEFYQWGITPAIRKRERERDIRIRDHKCKERV